VFLTLEVSGERIRVSTRSVLILASLVRQEIQFPNAQNNSADRSATRDTHIQYPHHHHKNDNGWNAARQRRGELRPPERSAKDDWAAGLTLSSKRERREDGLHSKRESRGW